MSDRVRVDVLGCLVDNLTMSETVEHVAQMIAKGGPHQHVVVNADKIVKAHADPHIREIVNECDLVNVDGMPVIWAAALLGRPLKERVTGIDLFERLVKESVSRGWRLYFLGAKEAIVRGVVARFETQHPGLQIAGWRNGYWSPDEEAGVVQAIAEAKPDVLFVAISSPKKEEFLKRYQREMKVPFAMGVGGSFDVVAGLTRRAPKWMQATGFEWFYRFLQEPRRMFHRYFVEDMYFFWLLARALVRAK
jgi:N-acetylglucosaminyldiphosphoundecaprenol N-acetyl-beta-D-mannosaminyltransferase